MHCWRDLQEKTAVILGQLGFLGAEKLCGKKRQVEVFPDICQLKISVFSRAIFTFQFKRIFSPETLVSVWLDFGQGRGFGLLEYYLNEDVTYGFFSLEKAWTRNGELIFLKIDFGFGNCLLYFRRHSIIQSNSKCGFLEIDGAFFTIGGISGLADQGIGAFRGVPIDYQINPERKISEIVKLANWEGIDKLLS